MIRPGLPNDGDPHPSETALDRYWFDELVVNDGIVGELQAIADQVALKTCSNYNTSRILRRRLAPLPAIDVSEPR